MGLECSVAYILTNSNQSVLTSKEISFQVCSFKGKCQNFWPFLTSHCCCFLVTLPLLPLLSLGTVSVSSMLLSLPKHWMFFSRELYCNCLALFVLLYIYSESSSFFVRSCQVSWKKKYFYVLLKKPYLNYAFSNLAGSAKIKIVRFASSYQNYAFLFCSHMHFQ